MKYEYKQGTHLRFIAEEKTNERWSVGSVYVVEKDYSGNGTYNICIERDDFGLPNSWRPRFFELAFKKGDKVKYTGSTTDFFTKETIYTVREYPTISGSVGVMQDEGGNTCNGMPPEYFVVANKVKTKMEHTPQEWVKRANRALKALRKFDNIELKYNMYGIHTDWQSLHLISESEYRVVPKPRVLHKIKTVIKREYDVIIDKSEVKIGCKLFGSKILIDALKFLLEGNCSSYHVVSHGILSWTSKGLNLCNDYENTFSHEEVIKLYRTLLDVQK